MLAPELEATFSCTARQKQVLVFCIFADNSFNNASDSIRSLANSTGHWERSAAPKHKAPLFWRFTLGQYPALVLKAPATQNQYSVGITKPPLA